MLFQLRGYEGLIYTMRYPQSFSPATLWTLWSLGHQAHTVRPPHLVVLPSTQATDRCRERVRRSCLELLRIANGGR
jgi:hypothetical protein